MSFMAQAIELARVALGSTSPNPAVGAVLVKDGQVVAKGATQPPGQAHAEVVALSDAGERARGATLYVTLEPCCHWGRTPPCTGAIIDARVAEVVVAVSDPNPVVAGNGIAELRAAGITVSLNNGELSTCREIRELYEGFAKHISTGMPFVLAKFAMSLDGKIATHKGDSKWVTGPEARSLVQQMRRETDAIMVGANTIVADDPQLTARGYDNQPLPRQPIRVTLDSLCRMPVRSQLLRQPGQTLVYTTENAPAGNIGGLLRAGADVVPVGATNEGLVSPAEVLADLGRRGVVTLLVEGGGKTLGSFFDDGLVDKVHAFVAPVIIGGIGAASPVEGAGAEEMAYTHRLEGTSLQQVGPDWLITGYPQRPLSRG
ncbi:Riboflavin biosynthesis protein RibD [Geodia barretti]|uniref:Riboflavin biosynthesis protein RibD n=1 Tax=Geodia barretti TaxID=519541 RepID=A0AA35XD10_GEOBA|nr:Riboflavin biosynthesis protein RibD [Geodia barretti]